MWRLYSKAGLQCFLVANPVFTSYIIHYSCIYESSHHRTPQDQGSRHQEHCPASPELMLVTLAVHKVLHRNQNVLNVLSSDYPNLFMTSMKAPWLWYAGRNRPLWKEEGYMTISDITPEPSDIAVQCYRVKCSRMLAES